MLKAVLENLVVKPENHEEVLRGIVIPDKAKNQATRIGLVEHVGPGGITHSTVGKVRKTFPVRVGDRVVYRTAMGVDVTDGGEEYVVLPFAGVLAVIDGADEEECE